MIYIHIPFCRSYCNYCGFYSELASKFSCEKGNMKVYHKYTDLICKEILSRKDEIIESRSLRDNFVDTLYIGGGTPSVLPPECLLQIIQSLDIVYGSEQHYNYQEFTIEVNPEDIVSLGGEYVQFLKTLGVNRISMGFQSFNDEILKWMHRRHNVERGLLAYKILRNSGIENISIDLIFGFPSLSNEIWYSTIDAALSLSPEHISAYQLSIDENSELALQLEDGKFVESTEEQCCMQYRILCDELRKAGYEHYEISNFSKPGFNALHNSAYWKRVPYIGIGSAAHSLIGRNVRKENTHSVLEYQTKEEILNENEIRVEEIMLALRTSKGIKKSYLYAQCENEIIDNMLRKGDLYEDNDMIRIPESRFFISDSIISQLI